MPIFLGRGVLSPPFDMFWSRKSCPIKFVNVGTLKVSDSLEPEAFNLKSRSMLMTPCYLLKLNDLSVVFCKLLKCMNAVQEPSLTPPNPKPCGLGDGGVMVLLLSVRIEFQNFEL